MKIGFIGLGNVGGKLAGSLLRNRFNVTVMDIDKKIVENFKNKGAEISNSAKELTEKVDLIITCLPSPEICAMNEKLSIFWRLSRYLVNLSSEYRRRF